MNPHLGTHAISVVNSSGSKIVIVTYECVEPSSDPVILNGGVGDLLIRRGDRLFEGTTDN